MKLKGNKLIFISRINRDGSGTEPLKRGLKKWLNTEHFEVNGLSMSENTYIASGFNSYVVKLKPKTK